jgi:hypothetical protein
VVVLALWYPPGPFGAGYNTRIFSGTFSWFWGTSMNHIMYSTVTE